MVVGQETSVPENAIYGSYYHDHYHYGCEPGDIQVQCYGMISGQTQLHTNMLVLRTVCLTLLHLEQEILGHMIESDNIGQGQAYMPLFFFFFFI